MKKSYAGSGIKSDFNSLISRTNSLQIIGVNSGTSCDGLDVSLVEFGPHKKPALIYSKDYKYNHKIRKSLLSAGDPSFADCDRWMELDSELGMLMGGSLVRFKNELMVRKFAPRVIASHGHTVRHLPGEKGTSYTLQLGDPARIARASGLPVISDFRKSDIAAGGQGAPLSPILHQKLFRSRSRWRAVVNIGGIANITVLPPFKSRKKSFAADCGPGNMVIDDAARILFDKDYDRNGKIASSGTPDNTTVKQVLRRGYFKSNPPKSTGREMFGIKFTESIIKRLKGMSPEDIIATVSEITVKAILDFITRFAHETEEIYICGGGAKNRYLYSRIVNALPDVTVKPTSEFGYDPDYIESMLWAYLGYCFIRGMRIDSQRFTGASKSYIPGKLCLP